MNPILQTNQSAWDRRAREGGWYVDTACDSDFVQPLQSADPRGWLGPRVSGLKLLCLAAGGGRHGPLFAAAGATVTVVDLSPAMLELDRQVAAARGLEVKLIQGSMDDLSFFGEQLFDAVFQPVSSCYVPDVSKVFAEVARVLKPGSLYLSQHKQPCSLQASDSWNQELGGYLVCRPAVAGSVVPPPNAPVAHREAGTIEFVHRLQDLIGGLCRAGFVIEDAVEPRRENLDACPGTFEHRSAFLPPFIAIKARRTGSCEEGASRSFIWTPSSRGK